MKILYTIAIVLLLFVRLYSQEKYPIKSVKSVSELVRMNTLRFKKIVKIDSFKSSTDSVFSGDEITLSWQVDNIQKVTLEVSTNGIDYSILKGNLESQGFFNVNPKENLFYRINAENKYKTVRVIIKEKPLIPIIEYFTASKEQIKKGEKVKLSWSVRNVIRVTLEFGENPQNTIFYKDFLYESFEIITPPKTTYWVLRVGDLTKILKIEVTQ